MNDETPTEYLILDVLAARLRTGEVMWTFPRMPAITKAARSLEASGLISTMSGMTEGTFRANLTDVGKRQVVSEDYAPPVTRTQPVRREAATKLYHALGDWLMT